MCGIAGIYFDDPARPTDRTTVERMVAAMRHRGPDGSGFFDAPGVCIGMCRLAIIDVDGGVQPMLSDDGRIALIQNGEIYNHVELRDALVAQRVRFDSRSDTEVLLRLYEREGDRFARELNGMFGVAVYDARAHRLILARDRLGKKPLYVWRGDGVTVFASELRALLASGLVPIEVDPAAVWDVLSYNYVPDPHAMLRGVAQVPPAHIRTVQRGAVADASYWTPLPAGGDGRPDRAIADDLVALIEDAVRIRLRADVPVGVFLSGGLDSSTIAWAAAREAGEHPVTAYTVSFPGDAVDEAGQAAETAAALGVPHAVVEAGAALLDRWPRVLDHCGAPHGDVSFLALDALSEAVAPSLRVALTGDGADELLGGYGWHVDAAGQPHAMDAASLRARWERNSVFDSDSKQRLAPRLAAHASDSFDRFAASIAESADLDPITRHAWADVRLLLPGNNLVKVDRMGMAHALELRSPFLDYRLVEFSLRVPGRLKAGPEGGKRLLRAAMAGRLPAAAAARPKHLFTVPVARWLQRDGAAAPLLDRLLADPSPLLRDAFEADVVTRCVREYQDGRAEQLRRVRLLLALDLWSRQYQGAAA